MVSRTEETKTFITFDTPVHRVKMSTDDMDRWVEKFEKDRSQDTYRSFVVFIQKKIKPITEAVVDGKLYQESFNEVLNHILTQEIGVDTIMIGGDLTKYQTTENKEQNEETGDVE